MMAWHECMLADVIEIISGGTPKTKVPEYWEGDIPWLSVADFNTGFRWVDKAEKQISHRGLEESSTSLLQPRQVIISARGTVGVVAQVARPMAFNQSCYGLKGKEGELANDFLYYLTKSVVSQMKRIAHGGVFDTITRDTFDSIAVSVPPLEEQLAIVSILGTLDDKIELNRKMNQALEAMAREIFKSWFVDFDPVHAKAEGRDPGLPPDLAALFPDSFEDSELGEIPKGWKVRPFSEFVQIIGGGTPKTAVAAYWGGNIPWFSVVDAPDDGDVYVVNTDKKITQAGLDNSAAQLLPEGTTIISARGTVGKVALVGMPMAMNQSCYGLLGVESGPSFTYFVTRTLVSILKQHGHGSVFNTITRNTLAGVNFVSPPKRLLEAFEPVVAPMMQRIKNNLIESSTLSALRDALLPKLLSGEIRVKEAERFVDSGQIGLTGRVGRD